MTKALNLRASASSRWMNCTASATLDVSHLVDNRSNYAADLGTALHEVSEKALREGVNPTRFIGQVFNGIEVRKEHIVDIVKPYVDYVLAEAKGHVLRVEILFEINEAIGGTADAVVLGDDFIHVIDLKTGRGYKVNAVDNSQLMIYALGTYLKYGALVDVERIGMTIFQPAMNNVATQWIGVKQIETFYAQLLMIYNKIKSLEVSFVPSESSCRWCPASSICPALYEKAIEAAKHDFKTTDLSGSELTEKLALGEMLIPWFEALKSEAASRLKGGIEVPGYEMKKGRSMMSWINATQAYQKLRRLGVEGLLTEPTMRSPAQVRELIKLQHADVELDELVNVSESEPSLTKVAKAKVTSDATMSAQQDFKSVSKKRGK